jgi:putative Mg2+ transporter-C (MgtC) family protein
MHPADFLPNLRDMVIAYALSFPIGWNRERQGRSAGLRTFPLVAVASCGFILAGHQAFAHAPDELGRIFQGLITGIGFIGGGAILKQPEVVHGTATAASIWATGAIGAAVGFGGYDVAVLVSVLTLVTLWLLTPLERKEPDK